MKLTDDFAIVIRGNTKAVIACPRNLKNLEYVFSTLFMGGEINVDELSSWGLKVSIAPDLRSATEDDVEAALAGSYVADDLAGVERAVLLEFWNRMADRFVGVPDE